MTQTDFAKALLYADEFARTNRGFHPYLAHHIGSQRSGDPSGYHCLVCDPGHERTNHSRQGIRHLPGCRYLHYRWALKAAKELLANPSRGE